MDDALPASDAGTTGDADAVRLSRGVARGDPDAFEALYRAWFARVLGLARAASGRDEAWCLDVTQDVMLRAARRLPALSGEHALLAWFARACLRAVLDRHRQDERRRRRERHAAAATGGARAVNAVDDGVALHRLLRELERLPVADYALLVARFAEGRTLREAGLAAGMGEGAAHGRVRRVLTRLRAALGGDA